MIEEYLLKLLKVLLAIALPFIMLLIIIITLPLLLLSLPIIAVVRVTGEGEDSWILKAQIPKKGFAFSFLLKLWFNSSKSLFKIDIYTLSITE